MVDVEDDWDKQRTEINALLKKHFSDSQFDNILLCVQGDLERCKKINLENWKKKADKQVEEMAEKAMHINPEEVSAFTLIFMPIYTFIYALYINCIYPS